MKTLLTLPSEKLLYDTKDCCAFLSIKAKLFYELIKRGLIRKHPSFKKCLVSRAELERFASTLS